jgi:hypothetical protein
VSASGTPIKIEGSIPTTENKPIPINVDSDVRTLENKKTKVFMWTPGRNAVTIPNKIPIITSIKKTTSTSFYILIFSPAQDNMLAGKEKLFCDISFTAIIANFYRITFLSFENRVYPS